MYFAQIQKTEARDRALGITPAAGLGGIALQPLNIEKERSKLLNGSKTSEQKQEKPIGKVEPSKKVSKAIDLRWSTKQTQTLCSTLRKVNL